MYTTARGKLGSKRHLITDRNGAPLAFYISGANRHDSVMFEPLVDVLSTLRGKPEGVSRWPARLHADEAYDIERCHRHLCKREITDRIACKGVDSKERLGRYR
ncbi:MULTISPECIES: transposase [Pseudomonas]|uniref:Transposase n=1 Tax=Pseudomonas luteola TaxID=47886 RepID=A0ABS0FM71_PSELU|nr:transposase [Pseudomonas zeshuii]MBF8641446.1 transposase [Pseudomonas zeshuii]QEU27219.1 transposase [Pseudomonas luteola]RRW50102.1 hypothetical protein EGJ50_04720 [Pseudomonas luteola]